MPAALLSLATASPPFDLPQDQVAAEARALFGPRFAEFERMSKVFESTGIERRQGARPISWFRDTHGWPERTAVYLEAGEQLFVEAAEKALATAGLPATDVDQVVTVSSTGVATPSLEARAFTADTTVADTGSLRLPPRRRQGGGGLRDRAEA